MTEATPRQAQGRMAPLATTEEYCSCSVSTRTTANCSLREAAVLDGASRAAALPGMACGGLRLMVTPPCLTCPAETLFEMEGGVKQCVRPPSCLIGDGISKFSSYQV